MNGIKWIEVKDPNPKSQKVYGINQRHKYPSDAAWEVARELVGTDGHLTFMYWKDTYIEEIAAFKLEIETDND